MRPQVFLPLLLLVSPAAALAQTSTTDSQTLQSLLSEVRQLRQDLRVANLGAQRVQILIHRVEAEQVVVDRISERLEGTKMQLVQLDRERARFAAQMKRLEDMKDKMENPVERNSLEDVMHQEKVQSEARSAEEQDLKAKEADLEEQFRIEQAKLGRLQDDLDRLDKTLEDSTQRSGAKLQ